MMKLRYWALAAAILNGVVWPAYAAEIIVPPGDGTLAAAIASASSGDTLVLQDGTYEGAVTVDKSLTIRPVNRGTFSVLTGVLTVQAEGIRVTAQRLRFTASVFLRQAAEVRLLENYFSAASIFIYGTIGPATGSPSLVIVGNSLTNASILENGLNVGSGIYVSGNTLLSGFVKILSPAWIVGNDITVVGNSGIYAYGTVVRVISNRVHFTYGLYSSGELGAIYTESPYAVIHGNIIEDGSWVTFRQGIWTSGDYATITNNIIRGTRLDSTAGGWAIYSLSSYSRISGNIVRDFKGTSGFPIYASSADADVSYNLCFNNSGDCPAGDGNLNADPQFVDLVDYRLAATSPAIDAGPPAYEFADLDRTRNDMGAYGGPYSIGQYDVQRDPANLAPFVYPLVNSAGGGILEAQALGVARLR